MKSVVAQFVYKNQLNPNNVRQAFIDFVKNNPLGPYNSLLNKFILNNPKKSERDLILYLTQEIAKTSAKESNQNRSYKLQFYPERYGQDVKLQAQIKADALINKIHKNNIYATIFGTLNIEDAKKILSYVFYPRLNYKYMPLNKDYEYEKLRLFNKLQLLIKKNKLDKFKNIIHRSLARKDMDLYQMEGPPNQLTFSLVNC